MSRLEARISISCGVKSSLVGHDGPNSPGAKSEPASSAELASQVEEVFKGGWIPMRFPAVGPVGPNVEEVASESSPVAGGAKAGESDAGIPDPGSGFLSPPNLPKAGPDEPERAKGEDLLHGTAEQWNLDVIVEPKPCVPNAGKELRARRFEPKVGVVKRTLLDSVDADKFS